MIEIDVNAGRLLDILDAAGAVQALRPPVQRAVLRLQAYMAAYPPQRTGANYRRTGTLGRRWTTQITGGSDEVVGEVGNTTLYGPFVQSAEFQARWHKGRWQTDHKAVDDNRAAIVADFERTIQELLR
jgi:hypothetical protein